MAQLIAINMTNSEILARLKKSTDYFQIETLLLSKSETLLENTQTAPSLTIIDTSQKSDIKTAVGEVQVLKQFFPTTFIIILIDKKIPVTDAEFLKKSGCDFAITSHDFLNTTRLDFILFQIVKSALIPIKTTDIKIDIPLDFSVYSLLSLNQKIVPVFQKGLPVTKSKLDKVEQIGELYVRRSDIDSYVKYIQANQDRSASGLEARVRAQFSMVAFNHSSLIFHMLDFSEQSSHQQGRMLLDKCQTLSSDLIMTLGTVHEPWKILTQSTFGMLGTTERSVMIATMAALTSLNMGIGDMDSIMLSGMLCDVGLLELSVDSLGKADSAEGRFLFSNNDKEIFRAHPTISLNLMLEKKFQLSDLQKEIVLNSHEQADQKGFPSGAIAKKIPIESQLLLFHELVDLEFRVKMGKQRRPYTECFKSVLEKEGQELKKFPAQLMELLKKYHSKSLQ